MKKKIGLLFGGRSGEHEVSLVSAGNIAKSFDTELFDVIPLFISRTGNWYGPIPAAEIASAAEELYKDMQVMLAPQPGGILLSAKDGHEICRLDAVFPIVHGTYGEDGITQGLLELADIPYAGAGVTGSAVCMDKVVMRKILNYHNIPQVQFTTVMRSQIEQNVADAIAAVEAALEYPVFIKPANGGSSVGINKAKDADELAEALRIAAKYDRKVLVDVFTEFYAFNTADRGNVNLFKGYICNDFCGSTDSGFHNATGCTEDSACAGAHTDRHIVCFIGKSAEVDASLLDHLRQFSGGDGNVYVRHACGILMISLHFKFLCSTRNAGHNEYVLGINAHLLCIVGLIDGAEHLLRRFAGREIVGHLGEIVFAELDPTGRAGSDHGQFAAVLETVNQFMGFFHNGQVGGKVHVVYTVKAKTFCSGNQFAFCVGAGSVVKAFTDGGANRGSHADHNVFFGIVQGIEYLIGIVSFSESANGTSNDTLTAVDALCIAELYTVFTANNGVEATVLHTDGTNALYFITGSHATTAKNALVGVTDDGSTAVVHGGVVFSATEVTFVYTVVGAEFLQFTGGGTNARQTFLFVCGKQQFKVHLSCIDDFLRVGHDFHAFVYRIYAGGNEATSALHFYKAKTASADFVDIFQVAQSGDFHTSISGSFQHGAILRNRIFSSVNFYIYHFHLLLLLTLYRWL